MVIILFPVGLPFGAVTTLVPAFPPRVLVMATSPALLVWTAADVTTEVAAPPFPPLPPVRTLVGLAGLPPPLPPRRVVVELEKGAENELLSADSVAAALLSAVCVVMADVTTTPLPSSMIALETPVAPAAAELFTDTNPGPASMADWASSYKLCQSYPLIQRGEYIQQQQFPWHHRLQHHSSCFHYPIR